MKTIGLDITALNDRQKTGIAVYNYNLIDHLLKINKVDRFILFGISTFATFDYMKNLPLKNYPNVEMKILKMSARAFRIAFLMWQKFQWPIIEKFTGYLDIYHSFNFYLPPQKSGKIVATVFDMTPMLFPGLHLAKTVQLDKVRMLEIKKRADLVITISENSKKDFLKFAPGKKVEVVYPGINDNFLIEINKSKTDEVLRKYKLEEGYVLCVGTLEPRKNIKFLINAYLESQINRKLVLVGMKGWKNSEIYKLVDNNREKIIILGFIDNEDLLSIYNRAICMVYPSLYEGFGLPILESFMAKTPVIVSRNSALKEVGGDAVYYINETNQESLIKALKEVVNNKNLQDELIAKGLKQASKFSWLESAKKLNFLYNSL